MGKLQTAILGRTTSYRLNAYDNADISAFLVTYVTEGTVPTGEAMVARRAREFIDTTLDECYSQRLLVKAYTLKWFNGFADLMWARFLERAFRLDPLLGTNGHFEDEHEHGPIDLFFWTYLLAGRLDPVTEFVETYESLTLSPSDTVKEVIAVQHANAAANKHTHEHILGGRHVPTNPKVGVIHRLAEKRDHPQAFLQGAARTQIAAGNWDSAFTSLLTVRF